MRTVKIILGDEFTMFNDGFTPWKKKKKTYVELWNHQEGRLWWSPYAQLALQKCNQ